MATTATTVNFHMIIHCEEKDCDLIDEQLIESIEDNSATTSTIVSIKEAFDRMQISTPSPAPLPPTGVRFGGISIREYPVIVGDNPGGTSGPPLSIGWEYYDEVTLDVLEYEQQRPPRRKGREMLVPVDVRVERLRNSGYSRAEIVSLTKPVNMTRCQRKRTLDTLHLQPLFQLHEKLSRKAVSLLTGGRRKKTEMELLAAHRPESAIPKSTKACKTDVDERSTVGYTPPSPPLKMEEDDRSTDDLSLDNVDSADSMISL